MGTDRLTWFNDLPPEAARQALLDCCAAQAWAGQMATARPFSSADDAIRRSSAIVAGLTVGDLADALAGHPRIGERPHAADGHSRAADWSRHEQSGIDADDTTASQALAEANRQYEDRFGHIYLVFAAGRSGRELLGVLRARLQNEPESEWQVVRSELQKITARRLQQLLIAGAS